MVTLNRIVDSAESGVDNLIYFFPSYVPPAVPGKFKVTYSNDVYAGGQRDSTVAYFEHTDYTFAHDNLVVEPGGASRDDLFTDAGLFTQYGTLILSNESGGIAKYVTFGLNNAADLYVPDAAQGENDIFVYLYDADVDDDGVWEFTPNSASFDDLAAGLVGLTVYQVKGTEGADSLFSVPLASLNDPNVFSVDLKPNHPYYVSLSYDGVAAGKGIMPRYSVSLNTGQNYVNFPTIRLLIGTMSPGWNGVIHALRLQLDGFDPGNSTKTTVAKLDVNIDILPNPAVDVLRANLDFGKTINTGTVSLMNGLGQVLRTEHLNNFQNGMVTFNVKDLASGTYLLSVRTPEGIAVEQVMVCH